MPFLAFSYDSVVKPGNVKGGDLFSLDKSLNLFFALKEWATLVVLRRDTQFLQSPSEKITWELGD